MTDVEARVLEEVAPSPDEVKEVEAAADRLLAAVGEACGDLDVDAQPMLVGSVAKGTWLTTALDIDCFLVFPPETPREVMEEQGLAVGRRVLDGEERYAEHPYIHGTWEGIEADVVPCFRIDAADQPVSAVDRTPHHNAYVVDHLGPGQDDEVRLLKQFLHGIGAYGAETKTQGFSGYLAEVLVLHFGTFRDVLQAARGWHPRAVVDPAGHRAREFEEPLVVVDPVDGQRNVAAAVSRENLALFREAAGAYLREPSTAFFDPPDLEPLGEDELAERVETDDQRAWGWLFASPDVVEDNLYPQLRKVEESVVDRLRAEGFTVERSGHFADGERCLLVWVVRPPRLDATYEHVGPPAEMEDHAERFREKWEDHPDAAGPVRERDGRLVVEVRRSVRDPHRIVEADLEHLGMGRQIEDPIRGDRRTLVGAELVRADLGTWLSHLFEDRRPWER